MPAACIDRLPEEAGTCMLRGVAGRRIPPVGPGSRPRALEAQRIEQVGSMCMPMGVSEHRGTTIPINQKTPMYQSE